MLIAGVMGLAGYVLPAGVVGLVRNWANVLGKQSADRIDKIESRLDALEGLTKPPKGEGAVK